MGDEFEGDKGRVRRRFGRGSRRLLAGVVSLGIAGTTLVTNAEAASAATNTAGPAQVVWGPRYGAASEQRYISQHVGSAPHCLNAPGEYLNGVPFPSYYSFCIQDDGNDVIYFKSHAIWWTDQSGLGYTFAFQDDGNLVEYGYYGAVRWTAGHYFAANTYNYALIMQNDGNLVEYRSLGDPTVAKGRVVAWASNTAGKQ